MSIQAIDNRYISIYSNTDCSNQLEQRFVPILKMNSGYKNSPSVGNKPLVGDFKQGYLNDCWLCAIVKSLSLTPEGNRQLQNMIKKNDDNSYTVTFPNNVEFVVTEDELKDNKLKTSDGKYYVKESMVYISNKKPFVKILFNPKITYSSGDKNLRIIEIGANKYVQKLVDEKIKQGIIAEKDRNKYCLDNYPIDEQLLFGDMSRYLSCSVNIGNLNPSDILMVGTNSDSQFNNFRGKGVSHHAYTVKNIDKVNKTISLINPHDTKEEPLVISFDDFYKRYSYICLKGDLKTTVSKSNIIENIHNPEYIRKIMDIAKKQSPQQLTQTYIGVIPNILAELGEYDLQAKYIANVIELSSKGYGTEDNCFKGALYSIKDKNVLHAVNKYLSEVKNPEYTTTDETQTILEKYINEEFSYNSKQELLDYIHRIENK